MSALPIPSGFTAFNPLQFFSPWGARPVPATEQDIEHDYYLIKEHDLENVFLNSFASAAHTWMNSSIICNELCAAAEQVFGIGMPGRRMRAEMTADNRKLLGMITGLKDAYREGLRIEREEPALSEKIYDFGVDRKHSEGSIPPTRFECDIVRGSESHRAWRLTDYVSSPDTKAVVILAPNSGTQVDGVENLADEARRRGYDVYVVAARDPRAVAQDISFRLDDNINAALSVGRQVSQRHKTVMWVCTSQSGITGMLGSSVIEREYAPHGMLIQGTPADTSKTPVLMNHLARNVFLTPCAIQVQDGLGAGRHIIPAPVPRHYLQGSPIDKSTQALAAGFACDMRQIFRDNLLATGNVAHKGKKVQTAAYGGHMAIIAGKDDTEIAPVKQVLATEKIMRGAASCMTDIVKEDHFGLLGKANARRVMNMCDAMAALPRAQPA